MIQAMLLRLIKMRELLSKIKINPLFWFVVGIGVLTGYFKEVLMVFIIVFIHEMGHALAAHFFQWKIKKIELLPFGGVAEVDNAGNRPIHEEIIIIIAGPIQHIWLIGLSFLCIGFPFWSLADHQLFLWHNLVILCFNLIPILPLDGGRLVQACFTAFFPYSKALTYSRWISFFMLGSLIFFSFIKYPFHLNLWVVVTFLVIANYIEWKQRHFRYIRFLMTRKRIPETRYRRTIIAVKDSMTLKDALKTCKRGYVHSFRIASSLKGTSYIVDEAKLLDALFTTTESNAPLSSFSFFDHDQLHRSGKR